MIVNVDLDGVVYDFHSALAEYIRERAPIRFLHEERVGGLSFASDEPPTPTQWNVWEDWDMTFGEWNSWFRRGVEEGEVWRRGPVISGAREQLWKLSDEGHHIRIVTDRLVHSFGHQAAVAGTAAWLDENNIPYRSLAFEGKKYLFATENSVLIDDKPANVNTFSFSPEREAPFADAVLFAQPWNDVDPVYLQPTVTRLAGWAAVYDWIQERV